MLVQYKTVHTNSIPDQYYSGDFPVFKKDEKKYLKETELYVVYGITIYKNNKIVFYITDENYKENIITYPMFYPAPLFHIVDSTVSKYWKYRNDGLKVSFLFDEWSSNNFFYDALTNGDETEKNIFKKYKELIDLESRLVENMSQ